MDGTAGIDRGTEREAWTECRASTGGRSGPGKRGRVPIATLPDMTRLRLAGILASAAMLGGAASCTPGAGARSTPAPAPPPTAQEDLRRPSDSPAPADCFDRAARPHTFVADAHIHFRPFNGPAIPFDEVVGYLEDSGVRFATVMGIGQVLPASSACAYYLDCPGTPVAPSLRNDFANATALAANPPANVQLALAMTFPDLSRPSSVLPGMALLDKEFPGMFRAMGEVNLVKQAVFGNQREAVPDTVIERWAPFMEALRERDMPLFVHADLGNDEAPLAYLPLIEHMLDLYPANKIVWVHIGLSLQLTQLDPALHVELMERLLARHPNLFLDISWRVVHDHYFAEAGERDVYRDFFNRRSGRILTGTDFLASRNKDFETYKEELAATSGINEHLNDEAFRNIALGQSYARLYDLDYEAPPVCPR